MAITVTLTHVCLAEVTVLNERPLRFIVPLTLIKQRLTALMTLIPDQLETPTDIDTSGTERISKQSTGESIL